MIVVLGAVLGYLAGRMLWLALRRTWQQDALLRKNYQGALIPTAAGMVMLLALLVVEGLRALLSGGGEPFTGVRVAVLVTVAGFTVLGLLDDLLGARGPKGFAGHVRALAAGQLTSGGVKMVGGAAVALTAAAMVGTDGLADLLLGAGVIALAANLFNLFDLRPGRCTKIAAGTFLALAALTLFDSALLPLAVVVGAAVALLRDELHERLMLGDTGANPLGAAIGISLVMVLGFTGTAVAFGVLLVLNLVSEVVSFTKIIDKTPPLAYLDRLGRSKPATIDVRSRPPHMSDEESRLARANVTVGATTVEDVHVGATTALRSDREQSHNGSSDPSGSATSQSGGDELDRLDFGDDESTRREPSARRNPVEEDRPEWPF